MKKTVLILLVASTLILALPSLSFAQDSNIHVKVDGEVVNFNESPFIQNNKTYVPIRGVFEKLGAKVVWKNNSKEIIIYKGRTVLVLILNNMWTVINDQTVDAGATPIMVNSKTFVPIRFISETLGATVTWDQQTQTINIVQNPIDDSEKSLVPLYNLKDRITTTKDVPSPTGPQIFPDAAYVYAPPVTPDALKIAELQVQLKQTKNQIIAAKECIQNDRKHISEGTAMEEVLKIDEANLKELESKIGPITEELKKFEESIYKTVSTL